MRSVEVEGDSIDHAIQRALAELGVERDRAAIEILNDASRGILGFGGRRARVRASVRAPLSAFTAADEQASVSRETSRQPSAVANPPEPRGEASRPSEPRREVNPQPERRRDHRQEPRPATPAPSRVSRETTMATPGLATNIARPARDAATAGGSTAPAIVPDAGELASRARALLEELLTHLGVRCEVAAGPGAPDVSITLSIRGESTALLIGKHGQTLDAIEHVLNRMLFRDPGTPARVEVDVEGYRERRRESLVAMARRMADKVRQTGRPATMDLMNPRDRRVVHVALKEEAGVTSRSQGEGFLRKIVVLPAGRSRGGARPGRDGE
jgi:spoIIIJ-associated protein